MALKKKVIKKNPVRTPKVQQKNTSENVTDIVACGDDLVVYGILEDNNLSAGKLFSNIVPLDCEVSFIKTHPDAKLPTKAYGSDNCWDFYAVEDVIIPPCMGLSKNGTVSYVTIGSAVVEVGLKVGYITPGFGFALKPRSGLGFKHGIYPHAGEFDNEYKGNCAIKLYNFTNIPYSVKKGDRICQFKIEKVYGTTVQFVDESTTSSRGEGGFGSSGK
jgi:dUTP pyrophosphatase